MVYSGPPVVGYDLDEVPPYNHTPTWLHVYNSVVLCHATWFNNLDSCKKSNSLYRYATYIKTIFGILLLGSQPGSVDIVISRNPIKTRRDIRYLINTSYTIVSYTFLRSIPPRNPTIPPVASDSSKRSVIHMEQQRANLPRLIWILRTRQQRQLGLGTEYQQMRRPAKVE